MESLGELSPFDENIGVNGPGLDSGSDPDEVGVWRVERGIRELVGVLPLRITAQPGGPLYPVLTMFLMVFGG